MCRNNFGKFLGEFSSVHESGWTCNAPHDTLNGPFSHVLNQNLILHWNFRVTVIILKDIWNTLSDQCHCGLDNSNDCKLHDMWNGLGKFNRLFSKAIFSLEQELNRLDTSLSQNGLWTDLFSMLLACFTVLIDLWKLVVILLFESFKIVVENHLWGDNLLRKPNHTATTDCSQCGVL